MLIGPFVNGSAVVIGGAIGAFLGTRLPERLRTALPQTFGLASMGLGVVLIVKVKFLPAVILALILGAVLGELCCLEAAIGRVGAGARNIVDKFFPPREGLSQEEFVLKFVAILVMFCASGTGIFGALTEGMTGDPTILLTKSILDFFTAAIFASTLGYIITVIFIPQLIVFVILFFAATFIMALINPSMIADFTACGGIIMLATGFRLCGIRAFPTANMLPSLILVMPFSAAWQQFIA